MKYLNRGCIAFALVSVVAVATAQAQEAPPPPTATPAASEPPAAPMAPASHPLVGAKLSYFTATALGPTSNPTLEFGASFAPGISLGVGVNFVYSSLGLSAMDPTDKFAFGAVIFGAYYMYNKFPLAIGPEFAVVTDFAPSAASFNPVTLIPGMQFLYAPFNAPILFGTALDVAIQIPKSGGSTVIASVQPELRIVYAF